jgi:hypothetical protein
MARARALLDAVEADDAPAAATLLSAEIPAALRDRPAAWRYVRERLDGLLRDGLAPELGELSGQTALPDRTALTAADVPALVIGCRGDSAHPPAVAEQPRRSCRSDPAHLRPARRAVDPPDRPA